MDTSIYKTLQNDFITIRHLHSENICDEERLENTINSIKNIRIELEKESQDGNHKTLIYCIDTLFEIFAQGNREKIFDFADVIHNMPEICMGKRNYKSFKHEINSFRRKYGKHYFSIFEISLFKKILQFFRKSNAL